jgi:hypothetical protein
MYSRRLKIVLALNSTSIPLGRLHKGTPVGLILSNDEMIRSEAHRRAQAVGDQFREAIRPIYRAERSSARRDMPSHVGTCILFRVGDIKLIATAAHIIDQHAKADLLVGGEKAPVPLTGMFSGTDAPNGVRNLDQHDFSVSPVSDELAADLGNISYIGTEFISKGRRLDRKKSMYFCVGYPNSKNKDMHATKRDVKAKMWMHVSPGKSNYDK